MRHSMIAVFLLFVSQCVFSQKPMQISDSKLKEIKDEIEVEIKQLKIQMNSDSNSYMSDYQKKMNIEYSIEKYRIDTLKARRISVDYSTSGIVLATIDAEKSYDNLLNKCYQELLSQLNDEDKEIFKQAQRNWITFRDAERKLSSTLSKEEYSGGGTIQRTIVAGRILEITQDRVDDIIVYLLMLNRQN